MAGIRLVFAVVSAVVLASLLAGLAPLAAPATPAGEAKPAPYDAVTVTLPEPSADESFKAFRRTLAKVARSRVYADLAQLVVRRGFFWDRDFGGAFDPQRPGVENLAVAVGLEAHNGAGWRTLAAFAAEPTVARAPSRPGVLCGPAQPKFSEPDFDRLLKKTGTDETDWLYPRAGVVAVHAAPDLLSEVIETLGLHFIRVAPDAAAKPAEENPAWQGVVTPQGAIGYVERRELAALAPARLCYRRDITGRWHVAGFVGGGNRGPRRSVKPPPAAAHPR